MTSTRRAWLRVASVLLFAVVNGVALLLGGGAGARPLLVACAVVAVAAAVQAAIWDSDGPSAALLLSLPPLLPAVQGEAGWILGPLGALLLLGCELNSASWETVRGDRGVLVTRWVRSAVTLAGAGAVGSLLVVAAAGAGPSLGGILGLVVAGGALAAVGLLLFREEPARGRASGGAGPPTEG